MFNVVPDNLFFFFNYRLNQETLDLILAVRNEIKLEPAIEIPRYSDGVFEVDREQLKMRKFNYLETCLTAYLSSEIVFNLD